MKKVTDKTVYQWLIVGSWSNGQYPQYGVTGTYRQALLRTRALANKMMLKPNSFCGSALLSSDNKVVAGYYYDDHKGYNNRELERLNNDCLELHNSGKYPINIR